MKANKKAEILFFVFCLLVSFLGFWYAGTLSKLTSSDSAQHNEFRCGALQVRLNTRCEALCQIMSMHVEHRSPGQINRREYNYSQSPSATQLKVELLCVEGQSEPHLLRVLEEKGDCRERCYNIDYYSQYGRFLGSERRQSADEKASATGQFNAAKLAELGFVLNSEGRFKVRQRQTIEASVQHKF